MGPLRFLPRSIGLAALAWCIQTGTATAFPLADEANPSTTPTGADLSTPDLQDLQHQMGLASGFASFGSAQGWTILPRLSLEEEFTDNVLERPSPRQWDLTTIAAPGVAVLGDSDRAQLRLDYQPTLEMHITTGSQNVLAQQLNTVGTLTVMRDLFFVDVRALAGVQATNGGIGGQGGLGQPGTGGITGATITPGQTSDAGLAKQDRSQTASVAVSPYMLYQFGDLGTGKIGGSLTHSTSATISGFAPIPLISQGVDDQSMSSVEETANFTTGDQFTVLRDTFSADGRQSTSSGINVSSASRDTANDRIDYQTNRSIDLYVQVGWEDISYSGKNALAVNDLTWGFGTVLTPDPDSELTLGYGHQNGTNSLTASGHYALTARTILTVNYTNGIGTQLEQVSNQLDQASVANNGSLVNSQTGAPLFAANNALGVEPGIYRFNTLTFNATTVLNRDTFTLTAARTQQTQVGVGVGATSRTNGVTTGTFSWTHELNPDLVATATTSYSLGSPTAGNSSKSLVVGLSLQYILSDTVSTFARYSFYDMQSSIAGQSWYQDLFLVGVTKQF